MNDRIFDDLSAKFNVLSACELELGLAIAHNDLNRIHTPDDLVRYFDTRQQQQREREVADEQHWTKNLPPNVTIVTGGMWVRADAPIRAESVRTDEGLGGEEEWGEEAEEADAGVEGHKQLRAQRRRMRR